MVVQSIAFQTRLYVTRQALLDMVREVLSHHTIETGWGVYGLIHQQKKVETVTVAGILPPSPQDIRREFAHTQVGGPHQAEAVRWLEANFRLMKQMGVYKGNARVAFLFKGHSHHQLGMHSHSFTDRRSVIEAIKKDGLEVAVSPLANIKIKNPYPRASLAQKGTIVAHEEQHVWIKFYFLSQRMWEAGVREPTIITPRIIGDRRETLVVPPLGWQFTRQEDYFRQLRHLHRYGCIVRVVWREIYGGPPLEIQFLVEKPGWRAALSIVTHWDHPYTPPRFKVLKTSNEEPAKGPATQNVILLDEKPLWERGMDFIEAIFQLEARGDL